MLRPALLLIATLLCLTVAPTPTWAENEGQADLDRAAELKLAARGVRDLSNINRVVELLDQAIEKGLDDENKEFAEAMLSATLMQRATALSAAVLNPSLSGGSADPRWMQIRQMALKDLRRVVTIETDLIEAHLLIGRLESLPQGNRNAASLSLTRVIEAADDETPPEQLAQALALRGAAQQDPEKQLADFTRALELHPDKTEYLLLRARSHVSSGKYDQALADVDKAIEITPGKATVYEQKGLVLRAQGKPEEALAAFDLAAEIEAGMVGPYRHRAEIYVELGKDGKAIEQLTKALAIRPRDSELRLMRASLYSDAERYSDALKDVESFLAVEPASLRGHLLRVGLLGRLGREEEAVAMLETLSEAAPDIPEIHLQLGSYYLSQERSQDALGAFSKAIEIAPNNELALRMRGDSYLSIGKHKEALDDFSRCYKISPEDPGLLNNYAWTLATSPFDDLRDGQRAVELATSACELTKYELPHILSTLAAAYAEAGQFDKAVEWSKKAVELEAEDERVADLSAELSSYEAGRPWRELQEAGGAEPSTDDSAEAAPDQPARTFDF